MDYFYVDTKIYYIIISIFHLILNLFSLVLLLNQRWSPPLRLHVSDCSTFRITCDVPSTAVFCGESVECFPGMASKVFFKPFLTILVAPIITGIIIDFTFPIRCISILLLLLLLLLLGENKHCFPYFRTNGKEPRNYHCFHIYILCLKNFISYRIFTCDIFCDNCVYFIFTNINFKIVVRMIHWLSQSDQIVIS